jgi:glycine/D-amino acid oxidase-like deaminating enzyme
MLAAALHEETGVDVALRQPGGFHFCFSDDELAQRHERLATLQAELGDYPYQMLDAAEVRARIPQIGPDVLGASYTPMDGHVNPLKLLRALHAAMQACGSFRVNTPGASSRKAMVSSCTADVARIARRARCSPPASAIARSRRSSDSMRRSRRIAGRCW